MPTTATTAFCSPAFMWHAWQGTEQEALEVDHVDDLVKYFHLIGQGLMAVAGACGRQAG